MSDFLTNLLDRHLGLDEMVLPRALGRFEPDKNVAATVLPLQAQEDVHNLGSEVAKPATNRTKVYKPDQSSTNEPVRDQREAITRSLTASEQEIIEERPYNASPEYVDESIPDAPAPIDLEFSTSDGLSNDSVRHDDNSFHGRADNRENKTRDGSVATVQHGLNPSLTISEQSYSTQANNPIPTVPNNTQKSVNNRRSDQHQTPTSKRRQDLSVNLTEEQSVIAESLHDKDILQHTNSSSQILLEVPASLSQQQIELPKEWSMRRTKDDKEPVVNVTIGRIEVRAVAQQTPPPRRKNSPKPKMSLDDYLKQRSGDQ